MNKITKIINGNYRTYVKIKCSNCNKPVLIIKRNYEKNGYGFCNNNQSCRTSFLGKKRNTQLLQGLKNKFAKSYLIGLICTDGHISWPHCTPSATSYTCEISLKTSDVKLLTDIMKIFGGKIHNKPKLVKWYIHDKDFVIYLRDIVGISNSKDFTLSVSTWYNKLKKSEKFHFLRGVIDGDGCIYKVKQKRKNKTYFRKSMFICSASTTFSSMISSDLLEFNPKVYKTNNLYTINFHNINAKNLLLLIYKDPRPVLFLERKFYKFKSLFQE